MARPHNRAVADRYMIGQAVSICLFARHLERRAVTISSARNDPPRVKYARAASCSVPLEVLSGGQLLYDGLRGL